MRSAIELTEVVKRHPSVASGTSFELGPITLDLPAGSWTAITGRSGAGKTTLVHLLAGLDVPDSGSVTVYGGNDASRAAGDVVDAGRARIGIVHQRHTFINHLPVWQNVSVRFIPDGMPAKQRREFAADVLAQLGVREMLDRHPESLSGGEQQRVAVARAIVHAPDILVADEPTSDVDAQTAELLVDCFKRQQTRGGTIVVVTHDPMLIDAADRRIELRAGQIVTG